jgi:hypothetical protein
MRVTLCSAVLVIALIASTCSDSDNVEAKKRIEPVYDKTGKLQLLKYDADGNGKVDTWSYMDGARVVRIEIDKNEDGNIDRWEYYGADQKLEKVGSSHANDGKEDAWSYAGTDGSIARIEVSTRRDGKVNRFEYYEKDPLVRAPRKIATRGRQDRQMGSLPGHTPRGPWAFDSHRGDARPSPCNRADGSAYFRGGCEGRRQCPSPSQGSQAL